MISERYRNDGIATWNMNDLQQEYKSALVNKIRSGLYKLNKVDKCVCGSNESETLSEKDRFGLNFETKLCLNCGLVYTSPRLDSDDLADFYSNIYWGLTTGKKSYENNESVEGQRLSFIKKCINRDESIVVEIGCGSGHNLFNIREHFKSSCKHIEVYGCDYSEECVEKAKADYGIKVFKGDSRVIEEAGIKADLIVLSHVLEHFTDLQKEIELISSILKDNGSIYIEVPGLLDLKNKHAYRCDFINYLTLSHNYCFCLGTLENIMGMYGFKLVCGNEYVSSIFKKDVEMNNKISIKNYSGQIYDYLISLERKRKYYNNLLIYKRVFGESAIITFEENYAVYGTGKFSEYVTQLVESLGANVSFYSDSDNNKWGKGFKGKTVISPIEILKLKSKFHKIIIASMYKDEIKFILEGLGIDIKRDVLTLDMKGLRKVLDNKNFFINKEEKI